MSEQDKENILFGKKSSRWYQVAALHAVEKALEDKVDRILIVHPTGAGKTITSGLVFHPFPIPKKRILEI